MASVLLRGGGSLESVYTVGFSPPPPVSGPPSLTPGEPLAGGGVGGTFLATWTRPPQIVFQGWVPTGETWRPNESWMNGVQLQSFFPKLLPDDAGPPPEGGGTYTVIRVVPPDGWLSELE
jgi:hypothetical protein